MDDADLISLGEHCQEPSCRQRDFLPFRCESCRGVYCLEHRTCNAHSCPKASGKDTTTILCPLCARLIKLGEGQDPNAVFERHTREDCEPSNYARVNKKPKCPVPGCRERLNLVNTHVCKHCSVSVCLKHRFAEDHNCASSRQGPAKREATQPLFSQLLGIGNSLTGQSRLNSQSGKAAAPQQRPPGLNAARERDRAGPQASILRAQAAEKRTSPTQQRGREHSGEEECPICHKKFDSLSALISHSKGHQADTSFQEVCPHCHALFANPVLLVEHVERHHSDHKDCVVC